MKKIIALLTLFVMTFTSGYATTGEYTTLNYDDILKSEIFYINGQGYTKNDGKLKKVEGIKFYSINGQRYINKNGTIIKVTENKIYKINNINFVKENGKLMTLNKYLTINNINKSRNLTFSEIYKKEMDENLKLNYLNQNKIDLIKNRTLEELSKMILKDNIKANGTVELLKNNKFSTDQLNKMKNYYFEKGDVEIAKKVSILENISKIDVIKVNKAISAKINNTTIKLVKKEIKEKQTNSFIIKSEPSKQSDETDLEKTTKIDNNLDTVKNTNKNIETGTLEDDDMMNILKAFGLDISDL